MSAERFPLLELRHISKRFGPVVANDRVDFTALAGEVHALVGENGAGKTTLMNIVFGLVQPDAGEIRLRGQPVTIPNPVAARSYRIGMVHQHFKLVPSLTVAENVFLGHEVVAGVALDLREAERRLRELSSRFQLEINPRARINQLSVGLRQRVEILKAMSYQAGLLILDEPTAVLTPQETRQLFGFIRGIADQGRTVIFITHKLNEVKQVADRFTVMRDGRQIATVNTAKATEADIARLMVGREVLLRVTHAPSRPGQVRLLADKVASRNDQGRLAVRGVSFSVREGEIVGIAGVEGNGQTELVESLTGLRPLTGGSITLDGRAISRLDAKRSRDAGVAHIPEDRLERGICGPMSIESNLTAGHLDRGLARRGLLLVDVIRQFARWLIRHYDIRGARPQAPVRTLSGGNMQKVVLAREMELQPRVLVAAQPTRGLDIGATEFVHNALLSQRDRGAAVMLVSADLNEIRSLSDRILVMYGGRIAAEFSKDADEAAIGLAMTGSGDGPRAGQPSVLEQPIGPEQQPPRDGEKQAISLDELRKEPQAPLPGEHQRLPERLRALGLGALQPAIAVALALVVGLIIVVAIGEDPGAAYGAFLLGSFTSLTNLGNMLAILTPILLAGISVALSFRAGVFNIGAEGQLYLGAFAAAFIGFTFTQLPGPLIILMAVAAGALAGALWALVPALLLARWGVGEIVTTLMFNYIAILLTEFLARYPFKDPTYGALVTRPIADQAFLPGLLPPSTAHLGLFAALAAVVLAAFLLYRTAWGMRLRFVGDNPRFAAYLGVSVPRMVVQAMLVSGSIAGIAGAIEVYGIEHRFFQGFSSGYGFLGLTVALLGRLNPWGVLIAGFVYAVLTNGARVMQLQANVPFPLVDVLTGIIVIFMTAAGLMSWWQRRAAIRGATGDLLTADELAPQVASERKT